MAVSEII